jgi:rhodanese-related sulfurtransferase
MDSRIAADEIDRFVDENDVFFLDVREAKELEELGTLEGYHNIPFPQLEHRLGGLPRDRQILTA